MSAVALQSDVEFSKLAGPWQVAAWRDGSVIVKSSGVSLYVSGEFEPGGKQQLAHRLAECLNAGLAVAPISP